MSAELLQVIESVAKDKDINREPLIIAAEQAVQVAGRRKYGHKQNIKAEIDRKTGEIRMYREYQIVENVENTTTEISLKDALVKDPNAVIEGVILELLPPIDVVSLGRVAAQAAKQIIVQKVRDAERDRQFENFKNRVGEIMNGIVKKIEFGNVIVDIGRDEAVLKREHLIRNEVFKPNDRIRVYIEDVRKSSKGPQIFLSRTSEQFLAKLFYQEVPEVYDGIIEIKAIAREPGSRAKMAVYCRDSSIDPVGSCVGLRGVRVQAVMAELQGEKIDIINWSIDPATFVVNALSPAVVSKVVIDEDTKRIEVVVATDQLSLAIGRKGQNVRLASRLTGMSIDVLTDEQESKRRSDEFTSTTALFMEALDVDETLSQLLAVEGYTSVENIIQVTPSELASIEGFDEDLANELQNRARNHLDSKNQEVNDQIKKMGVEDELMKFLNLSPKQILKLAENGVKTLEDLGEVTKEEFMQIVPDSGIAEEKIEKMLILAKNNEE